MSTAGPASIRLDKWLWQARFCKSRGLAARLIARRTGAAVRVVQRNLAGGLVVLKKTGGRSPTLGLAAAGKILVEPEK